MSLKPGADGSIRCANREDDRLERNVVAGNEVPVVCWDEVAPHEEVAPNHFDDIGGRYNVNTEPDEACINSVVLGVVLDDTDDCEVEDEQHAHVNYKQTSS